MTAPPLPTTPTTDWAAVWAQLVAGQEPTYRATKAEARMFHGWARYNHSRAVYYSSIGPPEDDIKQFSLTPHRSRTP